MPEGPGREEQSIPKEWRDKSDEEKRKEVYYTAKMATWILEGRYHVKELSTIEGVRLRHIVQQCIEELAVQDDEYRAGESTLGGRAMQRFIPEEEAVSRWLFELYGYHADQIPHRTIIKDEETGQEHVLRTNYVDDYHQQPEDRKKIREVRLQIKELGHHSILHSEVEPEFLVLLNRIREKAHNP